MGNSGLTSCYVASAVASFKMICLHILEIAYCEVRSAQTVSCEWTENAISEELARCFNDSPESTSRHITAIVEKRLLDGTLCNAPSSVDDAPRIDIMIGGFTDAPNTARVRYFMEAKNLYCQDFIKSGNSSQTLSNAYAKRYISSGIDNILKGRYPNDTLLLGYVLNGTVLPAVAKINAQMTKDSRIREVISTSVTTDFLSFVWGVSRHPNGITLEHCFLQF